MSFYDKLTEQLKRHEGVRLYPYEDTTGHFTIGAGRNLTDRGITVEEVNFMLLNDILDVELQLDKNISWWRRKPENVQLVLCDMCFNLGIGGLLTFDKFLRAIRLNYMESAQVEMMDSRWSTQVGRRAENLKEML